MRRTAGAIALLVVALAATTIGFAAPAASAPQVGNECHGAFQGDAPGSLELEITDTSGTSVTFLATWETDDWAVPAGTGELDKILVCFEVDGEIVQDLTQQDKPTLNDGEYEVTVDFASIEDEEVCAAARLSGPPAAQNPSTTKSDIVCFNVGEPPEEETTTALRVTKTVVGDPGGDTFTFTVDCAPVSLTAQNTDGSGVTIVDGVATFTLGNGQSETFTGLPEKASCDVTETVNGTHQWTTTVNGTASPNRLADDVAASANVTNVAFENKRVFVYACDGASDVTSTEAVMNGSTDDAGVTAVDFVISGRDPVAGVPGSAGKYSAKATGLTAGTTYTYTVVFKGGSTVVGTSAACSFNAIEQAAVVAGVVLTAPATTAAPAPVVAGAALATTGSSRWTTDVVAVGIALMLLGITLLFGSRTRPRPVGEHSARSSSRGIGD